MRCNVGGHIIPHLQGGLLHLPPKHRMLAIVRDAGMWVSFSLAVPVFPLLVIPNGFYCNTQSSFNAVDRNKMGKL